MDDVPDFDDHPGMDERSFDEFMLDTWPDLPPDLPCGGCGHCTDCEWFGSDGPIGVSNLEQLLEEELDRQRHELAFGSPTVPPQMGPFPYDHPLGCDCYSCEHMFDDDEQE